MKDVFGPSGYRMYAEAFGRCHTRFHASVSNPATVTSRLVRCACDLLKEVRDYGEEPEDVLTQAATARLAAHEGWSQLQEIFEMLLGRDAVPILAAALDMSERAVRNALTNPEARYEPHFRVIAFSLAALRKRGVETCVLTPVA